MTKLLRNSEKRKSGKNYRGKDTLLHKITKVRVTVDSSFKIIKVEVNGMTTSKY